MRKSLPLMAVVLTSCGQSGPNAPSPQQPAALSFEAAPSLDVQQLPPERTVQEPPTVNPTSAPGVAFNYRYRFSLPGARIAALQEQHAQACERLTPARCRITGLLYRVSDDDRQIEASLQLKLDPRLARQFGRNGIDSAIASEGRLTQSEISGTDAAGSIRSTARSIADLTADLQRIQARLDRSGTPAEERSRLEHEADQLRQQIRMLRDSRDDQQDSLATTPMTFHYTAAEPPPPPAQTSLTLAGTFERAFANFSGIGLVLLMIALTLLPWALLAAGLWWLGRRLRSIWPAAEQSA